MTDLNQHANNLIFHCWNTEMNANLRDSIIAVLNYLYDNNVVELAKAEIETLQEIKKRLALHRHHYRVK